MNKRLISDRNGIKTFMTHNGDTFDITKVQDISKNLELNRAVANEVGKRSGSDAYNQVASIPAIIVTKWLIEEGIDLYNPDHSDAIKKKLNSSDFRYLRTSEHVL